jgi:hypothetical protein
VTNVAHQIGGSLGLAVLVAVFAAADSATLHGSALLAHRIGAALAVGAAMLAGALLIALAGRSGSPGPLEVPERGDQIVARLGRDVGLADPADGGDRHADLLDVEHAALAQREVMIEARDVLG